MIALRVFGMSFKTIYLSFLYCITSFNSLKIFLLRHGFLKLNYFTLFIASRSFKYFATYSFHLVTHFCYLCLQLMKSKFVRRPSVVRPCRNYL